MRPPIQNLPSATGVLELPEGVAGGSHQRMVGLRAMRLYALESKFCAECGLAATGETQHALAAAMHHGQAIAFEYTMKQSNDQAQRPPCSKPSV